MSGVSDVTLRPLTLDDVEPFVRWAADPDFCRAIGWAVDRDPEEVRASRVRLLTHPPAGFMRQGIVLDGQLVGYVDLAGMTADTAEFGIAVAERAQWGRGVGRRAGELTLRYGFGTLGLGTITAEVHRPNVRSHALMRALGFREVGLGDLDEYSGEPVPLVRYALRRAEFSG
ncbi:GNAT family N-acetyltransferase [Deinococcus ficus]|uniref:GNAT family N-acetyltransferase n=1 Tax=Deinococcus ficus TaxID=317577 RepID=UPI0003B40BDF|nr:GNAT family protein [Deinococcus ficus]